MGLVIKKSGTWIFSRLYLILTLTLLGFAVGSNYSIFHAVIYCLQRCARNKTDNSNETETTCSEERFSLSNPSQIALLFTAAHITIPLLILPLATLRSYVKKPVAGILITGALAAGSFLTPTALTHSVYSVVGIRLLQGLALGAYLAIFTFPTPDLFPNVPNLGVFLSSCFEMGAGGAYLMTRALCLAGQWDRAFYTVAAIAFVTLVLWAGQLFWASERPAENSGLKPKLPPMAFIQETFTNLRKVPRRSHVSVILLVIAALSSFAYKYFLWMFMILYLIQGLHGTFFNCSLGAFLCIQAGIGGRILALPLFNFYHRFFSARTALLLIFIPTSFLAILLCALGLYTPDISNKLIVGLICMSSLCLGCHYVCINKAAQILDEQYANFASSIVVLANHSAGILAPAIVLLAIARGAGITEITLIICCSTMVLALCFFLPIQLPEIEENSQGKGGIVNSRLKNRILKFSNRSKVFNADPGVRIEIPAEAKGEKRKKEKDNEVNA